MVDNNKKRQREKEDRRSPRDTFAKYKKIRDYLNENIEYPERRRYNQIIKHNEMTKETIEGHSMSRQTVKNVIKIGTMMKRFGQDTKEDSTKAYIPARTYFVKNDESGFFKDQVTEFQKLIKDAGKNISDDIIMEFQEGVERLDKVMEETDVGKNMEEEWDDVKKAFRKKFVDSKSGKEREWFSRDMKDRSMLKAVEVIDKLGKKVRGEDKGQI